MKNNYENRAKTYLIRRMPVIIRLDGKAFHTFTRGMVKPFDKRFMLAMQLATLELCRKIPGCVLGYTQSDEITLVLVDYEKLETDAWFDYGVEKMCSISASMCTLYFNRFFSEIVDDFIKNHEKTAKNPEKYGKELAESVKKLIDKYKLAKKAGGMFDARVFNVPVEEVTNCVLWRQQDATRNSISGLAQAHFSPKELHGKKSNEMQDMLMEKFGINWNNLPTCEKRGTAVVKVDGTWEIDTEMPILTGEGRNYIERLIKFDD